MEGTVGVPAADWAKMEAGCHSYHPLSSLFKYTDGVPRCDSQPKLILDLTHAGPQRQRPQTFHIHRHNDGVACLVVLWFFVVLVFCCFVFFCFVVVLFV